MAEMLISLAIMALILVAVAVAINASAINYRVNSELFRAVNSARQSLHRITTQVRSATAVDPNTPSDRCSLIAANGDAITYLYDSTAQSLYLVTDDDATDGDYLLCDSVTAMLFTVISETQGPATFVKNVQISITVRAGSTEKTLTAAAVVRRNLD